MADALLHVFGYLAFGFPLLTQKVYTSFREEKLSAEFPGPCSALEHSATRC